MGQPFSEFVEEFKFHGSRKWRFDVAWPALMVAFECEGGVWVRGRHISPRGFIADCEKYSTATAMGWSVIRAVPEQIRSGEADSWVLGAMESVTL